MMNVQEGLMVNILIGNFGYLRLYRQHSLQTTLNSALAGLSQLTVMYMAPKP
jgi:hypothetical protein